MTLADNLATVRQRLTAACEACDRNPTAVRLIAVSKEQPVDLALAAHDLGVEDFGENTAQGLAEKAEEFARRGRVARWHFIVHLQRNKVNTVLRHATMVHSVDRFDLAQALAKRAPSGGLTVLVQVNIGREQQKGGVDPDQSLALASEVARLEGLHLAGLMGIPPAGVDPAPFFKELAALSQALQQSPAGTAARELSMGMSQDFVVAIRYGATMVRVGTAIFGERTGQGVGP